MSLRKVTSGEPIRADDHNALVDAIRSATLTPGPGIRLRRTASGTTIEATRAAGGSASSAVHPYYLHTRSATVEGVTTTYFGVEPASDLWVGISWDKQAIAGLLTDATDPDDAGWEPATAKLCYLAGTLDTTGAITACAIEWGGKIPGETGTGTEIERIKIEDATETVPAYQSKFHVPLARLTPTTTGSVTTWAVEQIVSRPLTLMDLNINAILCRYPLAVF